MCTQIDTIIGNKEPSEKLKGLLVSLRDKVIYTLKDIEADIEVINTQAHSEGYEDHEIDLLIRNYLSGIRKTKRQIKYILYDKPRIKEQKKLIEKQDNFVSDANMSERTITLPTELKILPQDLEEITQEQQEQEDTEPELSPFEELKTQKPDYAIEDLKIQLDNEKNKSNELITQNKALEEKYKQLEARTRVSPSNSIPTVQGNTLRVKIVVNKVFREMLQLKGSKMIYANIVIDASQNKYVKLESI
jgi:hypothetical protein